LEVDLMEKRIIGYFEDSNQAGQAANELKEKGFNEISILGNENGGKEGSKGRGKENQNLSNGTMTGGAIGGVAGLAIGTGALGALGAAALLIPGIGPIVAMGPLAAALGGAVTGGVAGALVDYGIPKERSDFYETKIKEGKTVMILKSNEDKTDTVASILKNHGAKDIRVH
jgi:outer membrane lipoprotein SlyB